MKTELYVVQRGDTLTKIARSHNTTVAAIATRNDLSSINRISVGQRLAIPRSETRASAAAPSPSAPQPAQGRTLMMQFVDALNAPIDGLKVLLEYAGEQLQHITDTSGKIPAVTTGERSSPVIAKVQTPTGKWKEVAQITPSADTTYVRVRSPKVKLDSSLRPHEASAPTPQAKRAAASPPGTVAQIISPGGNPVQQVSMECPNPQNLRLGPNFKYREVILAASKRSSLIPQAIAAIMNAEAAKISVRHETPVLNKKTGKPAIGKDGKPVIKRWIENTGEWNPRSASPLSSARGMTQFLDASWIDQAVTDGTFLNNHAQKEGWLTTTTIRIQKGKSTTEREVRAFRLADRSLVTRAPLAKTLSGRPHLTGRASASDKNLQKLLDLRFDAEFAIHAAVDYGMQNLAALKSAGFKLDALNDGEKAKVVYLAHHLGLADSQHFINDTMTSAHAQYLLENQVGKASAQTKAEVFKGDYLAAHRKWLKDFVDNNITLPERMCESSAAPAVRDLISITKAIRSNPSLA
jgi:hypothetical protein